MNNQVLSIRKKLESTLSPMRYEHTLSVSFTCMNLAMCYGFSLKKAELAGLLHDCAKQYSEEKLILICEQKGILLTSEEKQSPAVIHANYGAWMAKERFAISDSEILSAIACHTTGKPAMTLLDQILFVADYIEPRRYKANNLAQIRSLAYQNLESALFLILDSTLKYLQNKNTTIHPMTRKAFDYYNARYHNKKG